MKLLLSRALAAATCACLLHPALATAADGEATALGLDGGAGAKAAAEGSSGGGLVRTVVGLAVVLAVIYGLHWVLKQVKASREGTAAGAGLDTLATLPLGPNRSLHLVRAGAEVVLVGAGEHGVNPIRTYSEPEARALGLLGDESAGEVDVIEVAARPSRQALPAVSGLLEGLRARTVIR